MAQSNVVTREEAEGSTGIFTGVDALHEFLDTHKEMNRAKIAEALDYTPAVITRYLKRSYTGDVHKIDDAVHQYLENYALQEQYAGLAAANVVMTRQVQDGLSLINYVRRYAPTIGLLAGESGIGKSTAMQHFNRMNSSSSIYIRLNKTHRLPVAFLRTFWKRLGFAKDDHTKRYPPEYEIMDDVTEYLKKGNKIVLLDEMQNLSNNALECVRSIQEDSDSSFVIAGTFEINQIFGFGGVKIGARFNPALHRRVGYYQQLTSQLDVEDVRKIILSFGFDGDGLAEWMMGKANRPGKRYGWVVNYLRQLRAFLLDAQSQGVEVAITDDTLETLNKKMGLEVRYV